MNLVFEIEARVKSSDHFIEKTGQTTFIQRRCTMDDSAQLLRWWVLGRWHPGYSQVTLQQLIIFVQVTWSSQATPGPSLQVNNIHTYSISSVDHTLQAASSENSLYLHLRTKIIRPKVDR